MWKIFSNWPRFITKNKLGNEKLGHLSQLTPLQNNDNNTNQMQNENQHQNLILKQHYQQQSTPNKIANLKIINSNAQFKHTQILCDFLHKLKQDEKEQQVLIDSLPISEHVNEKIKSKEEEEEEEPQSMDDLFVELDNLNTQVDVNLENQVATQMLYAKIYKEAIPYLKVACSKGSLKATYNLAICLQNGLGLKRNEEVAFDLFKKAANFGHVESCYNVSIYYLNILNDRTSCLRYLRKAACLDFTKAKVTLAILLLENRESFKEAYDLLASLKEYDGESSFYMAFCYENGYGCLKDTNKAIEWYKKSLSLNNEKAKQKLIETKFIQLGELMSNFMESKSNCKQLGHFTQSMSQFECVEKRRSSLKTSASYSQFSMLMENNATYKMRRNSSRPILCAY